MPELLTAPLDEDTSDVENMLTDDGSSPVSCLHGLILSENPFLSHTSTAVGECESASNTLDGPQNLIQPVDDNSIVVED